MKSRFLQARRTRRFNARGRIPTVRFGQDLRFRVDRMSAWGLAIPVGPTTKFGKTRRLIREINEARFTYPPFPSMGSVIRSETTPSDSF